MSKIVSIDAPQAAPLLLGWTLVYASPSGKISGRIVEVEAYTEDDPAAHSYRGKTERNKSLFEQGGTVYIYFTYGMHYCLNIAVGPKGSGQGVLIRAVEPVEGIDIMQRNRNKKDNLTSGPAKLMQAFGIPKSLNGTSIFDGPLRLMPGKAPGQVIATERIGIKKGQKALWRFYDAESPHLSRKHSAKRTPLNYRHKNRA